MPTNDHQLLNRSNNRQFQARGQLLGTIATVGGRDVLTGAPATVPNSGKWQRADGYRPLCVSVSGTIDGACVVKVLVSNDMVQPADADNAHPQLGGDIDATTGPHTITADESWTFVKTIIAVAGATGAISSGFNAG